MKRSEMIKKLCEPIQLGNVDLHLWPEEAEAILNILEKLGMRPTEAENFGSHYTIYNVVKWEPEDGPE